MRFPDSFCEIHRLGGRYLPLKWPNTKLMKIRRYFIIFLNRFFRWLSAFFGGRIVTQSLLDLKTSFLRFLEIFGTILKFRLSKFPKIWKFQILLGHFKGGYLPPGWRISRKEPGNRIFRSSRCDLKKSDQKIIFFRKVTTFWKRTLFLLQNVSEDFWASREDSSIQL